MTKPHNAGLPFPLVAVQSYFVRRYSDEAIKAPSSEMAISIRTRYQAWVKLMCCLEVPITYGYFYFNELMTAHNSSQCFFCCMKCRPLPPSC